MPDKNRLTVTIAGAEYSVLSSESDDYMRRIAMYVDRKIADKMKANDRLGTTAATVLTAITIADELHRSQGNYRVLKDSLVRTCDDFDKCRKELAALKDKYGVL
jgi:cell division protein ZapA